MGTSCLCGHGEFCELCTPGYSPKPEHPTCSTCVYHADIDRIGEETCHRWSIEVHGGKFYCADHREVE